MTYELDVCEHCLMWELCDFQSYAGTTAPYTVRTGHLLATCLQGAGAAGLPQVQVGSLSFLCHSSFLASKELPFLSSTVNRTAFRSLWVGNPEFSHVLSIVQETYQQE